MTSVTKKSPPRLHHFIDQFKSGETLEDAVFLVSRKDLRTTNNGSLYIHIVFADRTGQILARVWQATQAQYDKIPEGGFLRCRGRVESYKGNLQFIVDAMRVAETDQIDLGDYLPRTKYDIDEMWQRVLEIMRTIENPDVLALITAFVKDEKIEAGFKKAPAAIHNHHAFIGGLLEHTSNLLELAIRIFGRTDASDSFYPAVSRDLILAGIFLHDIGKTGELTYETNLAYSTEGRLVGHITQAAIWIDRKIVELEQQSGKAFPEDLRNVLIHIVLSHHGSYEFGSPKLPACPEAIVVHYLDNIDAKLNMAMMGIDNSKNEQSDWSEFVRPLDSYVFKKDIMGCRTKAPETS